MVPVDDAAALEAALRRVIAEPGLAAAVGAAGARRVERSYSWERVADAIGETLDAVVAQAAVSPPGARSFSGPPPIPDPVGPSLPVVVGAVA
jgi:hypothetical protein